MSHSRPLSYVFTAFILLTLLIASVWRVSSVSSAAIIEVNSVDDNDVDDAFCTLREAIIAAWQDSDYAGCSAGSGPDTIVLPEGIYTLKNQLPDIISEVTISGAGAATTIIQASECNPVTTPNSCSPANYKVFSVEPSGDLTVNNLTVRHGSTDNDVNWNGGGIINSQGILKVKNSIIADNFASNVGGGIYNNGGQLELNNSTVSGNVALEGGGIHSSGDLFVQKSTISGNTAVEGGGGLYTYISSAQIIHIEKSTILSNLVTLSGGAGGGIYIHSGGKMIIVDSTLSGNSADNGGAIYNRNNSLVMVSSTVNDNSALSGGGIANINAGTIDFTNTIIANSIGGDCFSNYSEEVQIVRNEHNLVEDGSCAFDGINFLSGDPFLGPLADNGGPTLTHALLDGSPAIDTGFSDGSPNTDQRGVGRPQGAGYDIGAYEFEPIVFYSFIPILLQ